MPWHIETTNPACASGYAVVKDSDGEVEGCHRTRREALAQLAALNIAEDEARFSKQITDDAIAGNIAAEPEYYAQLIAKRAEGYAPNDGMVAEARRGLEWREAFGRGGTEIGVARARDIVNRKNLSRDTVARMVSYFARHEVDKNGEGFSRGDLGYPSAGRIAWALWGGDPGKAWAQSIIDSLDAERALVKIDPSA